MGRNTEAINECVFLTFAVAVSVLAVVFAFQGEFWLTGFAIALVVFLLLIACSIVDEKEKNKTS